MQCHYLSVLIRDLVMSQLVTPQLVQLLNVVSNSIFHCSNCDANRVFVTFRENTAAVSSSGLLNEKFTFK